MLTIKYGDVFKELKEGDVFVHGVNSRGVMGSGVAKIVRDTWPKAYRIYKEDVLLGKIKLGEWNAHFDSARNIAIVNLITQEEFGRDKSKVYVDYAAVKEGMLDILGNITEVCNRIVFPFIGGGLANGDRKILLDIFHEVFDNTEIEGVLVIQ